MKAKTIISLAGLFFLSLISNAQRPLPSDAGAFYQKAMKQINAKHVAWIKQISDNVIKKKMEEPALRKLASQYATSYNMNEIDIEALVSLVMMQASKDEEQDLKNSMDEMKRINEERKKMRDAIDKMNQAKNSMTQRMLDSFRVLTKPALNNRSMMQLNRTPQIHPVKKEITKPVTLTEIKQVHDSLKSRLDSMNEMSEMTSMQLQMTMDRRNKFISTISNIMKRIDQVQDNIIKNMK